MTEQKRGIEPREVRCEHCGRTVIEPGGKVQPGWRAPLISHRDCPACVAACRPVLQPWIPPEP